jgi:hypothetical protein
MKAITSCWIAGVIFVAGLSVGCSGGNKTTGGRSTNPYAGDTRMQEEMQKHKQPQ